MTTRGGKTPTELKRPKGREESEQHEDDQDEPGLTHREEESENVLIQPDLPLQSSSTTRYYSTVADATPTNQSPRTAREVVRYAEERQKGQG